MFDEYVSQLVDRPNDRRGGWIGRQTDRQAGGQVDRSETRCKRIDSLCPTADIHFDCPIVVAATLVGAPGEAIQRSGGSFVAIAIPQAECMERMRQSY